MKVLILSDGRAGHLNQSRAICMALEKNFPVTVTTLHCKVRAGVLRYLLAVLIEVTCGRLPLRWFRFFHSGEPLPVEKPDLIVSAGGHTLCANAWLQHAWGVQNLFCGDLRGMHHSHFHGIITAYEPIGDEVDEEIQKWGVFINSPTPVPINRTDLAAKAKAWRERTGQHAVRCWSLLAGGKGAGYRYSQDDWRRLATVLEALAAKHGIRWLITTSRRSGPEANAALSRVANVAGLALAGTESALSYHEILGAAERHFVTEDSHMMISEAIATGAPVHTLQPEKFHTDDSNLHFLRLYESKGWITRHAIAGAEGVDFSALQAGGAPAVMDELAEKLAAWWSAQSRGPHSPLCG